MPINLRYRLRLLSDAQVAAALERSHQDYTQKKSLLDAKRWWFHDPAEPYPRQRSFLRHRIAYRAKAFIFGLFDFPASPVWLYLLYPVVLWILGPNAREQILGPYALYLLKCEIEDLQDEIQRRVDNRKRTAT